MSIRNHTQKAIIIGVIFTVFLSTGIAINTVQADQTKIPNSETLRIINYKFSTSDIPEGTDAKLRITIQNTGATDASGNITLIPDPESGESVTLKKPTKSYNIEAGSRQSYIYVIQADDTNTDLAIGDRKEVKLDLEINGNTINSWETIHVLPKGSTVSEGSVKPTGERETINKTFTIYKDNRTVGTGSFSKDIPPIEKDNGKFIDGSQGRIFNFLSASDDNSEYASIETYIDGKIKVGVSARNIPDSDYYTIQSNYKFSSANTALDQVKFNIVSQNGTEIDPNTTYILSASGQRETRYFQLSKKEANHIRKSNKIHIVIENTNISQNQEKLYLYYLQLISSDKPLSTENSNIKVTNTAIYDGDGNNVTTNPEFKTGETITVTYTVKNFGETVGSRQVTLNINGEIEDSKVVEVNPGESEKVSFSFKKSKSGLYRYIKKSTTTNPTTGEITSNSTTRRLYVKGDEDLPPIAAINEPPEPNSYFNGILIDDPTNPNTSITLSAKDSFSPSGTIEKYKWDAEWINNTIVTQNPIVTLPGTNSKGTYNVVLTVVDNNGREDITQEKVRAGTVSPKPSPLGETTVSVGEVVELDASGSTHPDPYRCIVEYRWKDFDGDIIASNTDGNAGNTCVKPTPTASYSFTEAGTHTIELIAEDDLGNTGTATRTIHVTAPEPTASVTVDDKEKLLSRSFNFDASNSTSKEGNIVKYHWEMGDGTTYNTTQPTVSHTYSSKGVYTVKVEVKNEYGAKDTATVTVTALDKPFDIGIGVEDTKKKTGDIFQLNNNPTEGRANVDTWTWTMGDGTTIKGNSVVQHTYDTPGKYTVTLTGKTSDFGGYKDSETVVLTVMQSPPVAVINASYSDGSTIYVSDVITFDGSASYDPEGGSLDYTWHIGNSNKTFNKKIVNSYTFDETKLVKQKTTLTVTDPKGLTDTAKHTVTITARSPQASFTYSPKNPGPKEPTTFDASSSKHNEPIGKIVEYRWNFHYMGSGTDYTGKQIEATFPKNNKEYKVTLTVEDQWGQTDQITKTITTEAYTSCHEFLRERPGTESGYYQLDPLSTNNTIQVYCNMDYKGGGWTVIDKEAFYKFSKQIGNTTWRGGDIQNWNVGPNNIYSYDGGGNHYFVYWINTGFTFTQIRTKNVTFGSATYRANSWDVSEVRGTNTANGSWNDLNSGGVSGDIAIGTKNSVFTSWSEYRDNYTNNWWAYTGDDGVQLSYPVNGLQRYRFPNKIYYETASSIGVGWGESGGQTEGWEWETGSFMVRKPISPPVYFYNQGNNIEDFKPDDSRASGTGDIEFRSDHIHMMTKHSGSDRYISSDPIDLGKYKTIYIDYTLTVENGGSGYVEIEAGGKTARDKIDQKYLVNDNSMSIDVSKIVSTDTIDIHVHTSQKDTITTLRVDRVWGRKGGIDGNNKSKKYTVENPTNKTPTDYPVKLTINRPADMDNDYGSARFYQNGTKLDYHLVNYNNSTATFMVELKQLNAGTSTITMKYGANSLSTTSNPEATYKVYDYHGSGMDDGTIQGDASDQGSYALLTPDRNDMRGSLRYGTFNTNIGLKATYDWRHWGSGSPADSINFVTYSNGNNFNHEDPDGNGIHFSVVDHNADYCVTVNYNGQCDQGWQNNYNYDENWHTATASISHKYGDTYSYYFDSNAPSSPILNSQITANGLGNKFGFSGRTGGLSNNHAVKDITIRKWVGQPMEVYPAGTTEISGSHYLTSTSGSVDFYYAYDSGDFNEMFSSGVTNQGYWYGDMMWDGNGDIGAEEETFAWKYEGWIYAPETGTYTFGIDGDDAVDAYVDGQRVAYWYGGHGEQGYFNTGSSIYLKKGWHRLKARQEEGGGGEAFSLGWIKPGSSNWSTIPDSRIADSPQRVDNSKIET